jgi:hypothetical protein
MDVNVDGVHGWQLRVTSYGLLSSPPKYTTVDMLVSDWTGRLRNLRIKSG